MSIIINNYNYNNNNLHNHEHLNHNHIHHNHSHHNHYRHHHYHHQHNNYTSNNTTTNNNNTNTTNNNNFEKLDDHVRIVRGAMSTSTTTTSTTTTDSNSSSIHITTTTATTAAVATTTTERVSSTSSDVNFGSEHIVFLVIGCMVLFFMVCLPIDFYNYHKKRKDKKVRQGSSTGYSRTGPGPFHVIVNQEANAEDTPHPSRSHKPRHPFFKFMGLIALLKKRPTPSDDQNDGIVDDGVTPSTSTRSMSMSTMYRNSVAPSTNSMSPAEHIELPEMQCETIGKVKKTYNLMEELHSQ